MLELEEKFERIVSDAIVTLHMFFLAMNGQQLHFVELRKLNSTYA